MFLFYRTSLCAFALAVVCIIGCSQKKSGVKEEGQAMTQRQPTLFTLLPAEKTNITFNNTLTETPFANIIAYQYFNNGGGVAIADVNQDGLQDVYFSGNLVPNKLYLNKGNMRFEDVTSAAGVDGFPNTWKTGAAMADVNGDGLMDIYQCYSGHMPGSARVNQLFINQGTGANGVPTFVDRAKEMGLADSAYSTHAAFFDYDLDQDLDMFLLNHNPVQFSNLDEVTIQEILKKSERNMQAKLYQNNKGHFTDVSDRAGLHKSAFSYGLGEGISDINQDGWPDIYVSNDYSAPDFLLINNQNGTFTD
ncbi:MAG: FG-GAP repeat domain-containing protein [Rufibacter sp.]